ncbi:hypothetical protein ABZ504_44800 [Streptomyces mirabilis]|uniref:hypothetical protein n=1 Tax=Streptomyces mirabilis TaxID=68239 RepID=UPI000BE3B424
MDLDSAGILAARGLRLANALLQGSHQVDDLAARLLGSGGCRPSAFASITASKAFRYSSR